MIGVLLYMCWVCYTVRRVSALEEPKRKKRPGAQNQPTMHRETAAALQTGTDSLREEYEGPERASNVIEKTAEHPSSGNNFDIAMC